MQDRYSISREHLLDLFNHSPQFTLGGSFGRLDAAGLTGQSRSSEAQQAGFKHRLARFSADQLEVDRHVFEYEGTALLEVWPVIHNTGAGTLRVDRLDSFSIDLPSADYELLTFSSDWGQEFEPQQRRLTAPVVIETRLGRSSKGQHPWFALFDGGGAVVSGSIVWSGNWIFRFEPLPSGGWRVSGGLNDWEFSSELQPGESLEAPHAILVMGQDLNDVSQQYARVGRRFWYARNPLSAALPVEWNHWWSYEDVEINAATFERNLEAAARLGIEVCTLDAGWFGSSEAGVGWYETRGDWDRVNRLRFPQGLEPLAERAHALGLKFGLWCEIEAVGKKASLARDHPEFIANRAGQNLGYICFGNPDVQEWAFQALSRLIRQYGCDWIKLDFNVDPQAGCSRSDHGHGAGDGLYAHYRGFYATLERLRRAFPAVILESCSSGGLRIDLGMMRQTHLAFLSDPDWPVHDLQIFWGASTMLAPDVCLHWSFSEWRPENKAPHQTFNPRDSALTRSQLDYFTRMSMLGACGFSQKLPDLPEWVADRLKTHIRIFKEHIRRFISSGDLSRLTDQPRRDGSGERWCAFQYSLPDASEHLLFVFRLPGAEGERKIRLTGLQPERMYALEGFEGETYPPASGKSLMEDGLAFAGLLEEDSVLLRLY